MNLDLRLATASHPKAKIVLAEFPPDKRPWIASSEFRAVDLANRLKTRQTETGHDDRFHVLLDDGQVELVEARTLVDVLSRVPANPQ